MTCFQLDENFNDKDFAAECEAEQKCSIALYPAWRKGQKDHQMLPALLASGSPLLTLDHRIVRQNYDSIVDLNGGIIVVKLDRPTKTITTRIAGKLIRQFKQRFAAWPAVDWSKIYLELTESEAYISALGSNPNIDDGVAVSCADPDFKKKLTDLLTSKINRQIP